MEKYYWYAAYGSNMAWDRFRYYIHGGYLAANDRHHHGARNRADPVDARAVWLPGQMYFATQSAYWGGGRALYDSEAPGTAAGRAWLVTGDQLCDIMAQEMKLPPGTDLALPVAPGRENWLRAGDGHYETVVCTGQLAGHPVVTFRAPWAMADVPLLAPSPSYLAMIASGLHETFGWDQQQARRYLASLPGAEQ